MGHNALVFGASGILGWAVVDQIMKNYPQKGVFDKVTALSNRPLSEDNAFWPQPGSDTPNLQIVEGIDLTKGTAEELKETLKQCVPGIQSVTHVYYFAYVFHPEFPIESTINLAMLKRGLGAAEALAPGLQYVIFPTGTKGYGIHMPERPFKAPFKEVMSDVPQPYHKDLFYYVLHHELDRMQEGKNWKWAEVRCGPVIGFVPHTNPYNLPGIYMNYLSTYKFMHEQGHPAAASKEIPFPAPPGSYHTVYNDGGQDSFARFSIHLCLHPDAAGNSELYNIGDSSKPANMAERWPFICSLFGLVGVPPIEKLDPKFRLPVSFVEDHSDMVKRLSKEKGVELQGIGMGKGLEGWQELFTFNHDLCLDKARATGFEEETTYQETWRIVFDRYVGAKRAYYGDAK